MKTRGHTIIAPSVVVLALLATGCQDGARHEREGISGPSAGVLTPPHKKDKDGQPANFRLTGGGRVDKPEPELGKNTPQSRDFATFGFQARPTGPNMTEGSGNITWVEHDPGAIGGGFTFHGRVAFFTTPVDETEFDADCGRFGGTGRARTRDGRTFDGLSFTVEHACDKGEPGVGRDHIRIRIPAGAYERHAVLTGGNIQKHRL